MPQDIAILWAALIWSIYYISIVTSRLKSAISGEVVEIVTPQFQFAAKYDQILAKMQFLQI